MLNKQVTGILRVFSILKPKIWRYILGITGVGVTNAMLTILLAFVSKDMVNFAVSGDMEKLTDSVVRMGISVLVLCIAFSVFSYLFGSTVRSIMVKTGLNVFKHITGMQVSYFENHHSGDLISCLTNDIKTLEEAISSRTLILVLTAFAGVGSAITMFFISYKITLIMLLFCTLLSFTNMLFAKSIRRLSNGIQEGLAKLTQHLTDIIAGFSVIRMFHIRNTVIEKFDTQNNNVTRLSVKRSRNEAIMNGSSFLMSMLSFVGTVCISVLMGVRDKSDLGTITMIVTLQSSVTTLFLLLGSYISMFQTSLAGADRVFSLLDQPLEPERYDMPTHSDNSMLGMEAVSFAYSREKKVLEDMSFSVNKGQTAALVGSSGGGKSTIIKLLLGFYPVAEGLITIAGKAISQYTLAELRDMIAYVPQDVYLFNGTVYDNISYGKPDASKDEIITAAGAAYAHDFIMEMPEGYNTLVGEGGARLSGGQRQRIAIARAMVKNAPILLLDEATSALDSESEQQVQHALNELVKGRTVLVIAHRLSTIEKADIIYVIEDGRVIEQGKHEDLMQEGYVYKQLYSLQRS